MERIRERRRERREVISTFWEDEEREREMQLVKNPITVRDRRKQSKAKQSKTNTHKICICFYSHFIVTLHLRHFQLNSLFNTTEKTQGSKELTATDILSPRPHLCDIIEWRPSSPPWVKWIFRLSNAWTSEWQFHKYFKTPPPLPLLWFGVRISALDCT